jgi:hypothetical protein
VDCVDVELILTMKFLAAAQVANGVMSNDGALHTNNATLYKRKVSPG